jgi:hypothetical protein
MNIFFHFYKKSIYSECLYIILFLQNLQIYTLEVKFLKQQKTYLFSRDNYRFKYRLCFTSMEQVNVEYGTRREILRRPIFVSENDLQTRK